MRTGNESRRLGWRGGVDLFASIGMILVAGMLLLDGRALRSGPAPRSASIKVPSEPLVLAGFATKGSSQASVGLIVYSDFECPFCRRFALSALPVIERELIDTGLLLLAFGHLPLESIHPHALAAATLAECSHRNGDFWKAHDRLFSATSLSPAVIAELAEEMGFTQSSTCLTKEGTAVVKRQQQAAGTLGITGTPAFLLGTLQTDQRLLVKQALTGFQSAETIATAVRALSAAR